MYLFEKNNRNFKVSTTTQQCSKSGTSKQITVCFPLLRTNPAVISSHDVWLLLYNGSPALQNCALQKFLCRSAHVFYILDCVSFFPFCCNFLDSWRRLWFVLWCCFCTSGSFATRSTYIRILGDRLSSLSFSELGIIPEFQAEKIIDLVLLGMALLNIVSAICLLDFLIRLNSKLDRNRTVIVIVQNLQICPAYWTLISTNLGHITKTCFAPEHATVYAPNEGKHDSWKRPSSSSSRSKSAPLDVLSETLPLGCVASSGKHVYQLRIILFKIDFVFTCIYRSRFYTHTHIYIYTYSWM